MPSRFPQGLLPSPERYLPFRLSGFSAFSLPGISRRGSACSGQQKDCPYSHFRGISSGGRSALILASAARLAGCSRFVRVISRFRSGLSVSSPGVVPGLSGSVPGSTSGNFSRPSMARVQGCRRLIHCRLLRGFILIQSLSRIQGRVQFLQTRGWCTCCCPLRKLCRWLLSGPSCLP